MVAFHNKCINTLNDFSFKVLYFHFGSLSPGHISRPRRSFVLTSLSVLDFFNWMVYHKLWHRLSILSTTFKSRLLSIAYFTMLQMMLLSIWKYLFSAVWVDFRVTIWTSSQFCALVLKGLKNSTLFSFIWVRFHHINVFIYVSCQLMLR